MRITDTLDQLLRTLLASGTPAHEGIQEVPPFSAEFHGLTNDEPDGFTPSSVPVDGEVASPMGAELERLEVTTEVAETLNLGFHLGAALDRILVGVARGSEGAPALREAGWLIERYIGLLERRPIGADIHAPSVKLARTGAAISDLREIAGQLASEPELTEPKPEPVEQTVAISAALPVQADTPHHAPNVNEAPTLSREILVTAARAGIALAAVIVLVLVLTLIAQWR